MTKILQKNKINDQQCNFAIFKPQKYTYRGLIFFYFLLIYKQINLIIYNWGLANSVQVENCD
jgi:hypothetical protein